MLKKSFTLASVVSLTGVVVWISATTACGGDETPANTSSSSTSGASGDGGSSTSSGGTSGSDQTSSSSSSSTSSSSSSGLVDPKTVEGVDIPFTKCDAFEKAAGSVEGKWKITGGCLSDDTFDSYRDLCKQLKEHDVVIKAKGTLEADATNVKQDYSIFLSAKLDLPKSCANVPIAGINGCSDIPKALTGPLVPPDKKFDHMECVEDGDLCKCAADVKVDDKLGDTYTAEGGTLTTKGNRSFDYNKTDGTITYKETTPNNRTFGLFLKVGPQ